MRGYQIRRSGRIVPGAILIALGLVFLAGNLWSFDLWDTLWPLVLIALGLLWIVRGPLWLGVVSLVAGGIFLADSLGADVDMGTYWPLLIVALGVGILLERNNVGRRRAIPDAWQRQRFSRTTRAQSTCPRRFRARVERSRRSRS